MIELKPLTAEEQAKPYAKYYYREPASPPPELARMLDDPQAIDPAKALSIHRLNDLLDPGYHEVETGYCTMPDGSGYVAVHNKMPGVTVDMVRWWMVWHLLEDLRYKIWFPRDHYGTWIPDDVRATLVDPSVPLDYKKHNVFAYNIVTESIGEGTADVHIHFQRPEDLGFDMDRYHAPAVATTVGAKVKVKEPGASLDAPGVPITMVHFVRELDDGVEYRTRFWFGYDLVDGKPVLALPPEGISEGAPAGLFEHCISEYSNLRVLLPEIYAEQGGLIP
jgi:hypothetical protein